MTRRGWWGRRCSAIWKPCASSGDCDLQPGEGNKFAPLVVSYTASRHGEYDFGSYKRAFLQADLSGYDVVYLVNDSVVGPLQPLEPYLQRMEALGTDAFGFALNPSRHGRHLQSWFIGLKPSVFQASWFAEFLAGVEAVGRKEDVCIRRPMPVYGNSVGKRFTMPWDAFPGKVFRS